MATQLIFFSIIIIIIMFLFKNRLCRFHLRRCRRAVVATAVASRRNTPSQISAQAVGCRPIDSMLNQSSLTEFRQSRTHSLYSFTPCLSASQESVKYTGKIFRHTWLDPRMASNRASFALVSASIVLPGPRGVWVGASAVF